MPYETFNEASLGSFMSLDDYTNIPYGEFLHFNRIIDDLEAGHNFTPEELWKIRSPKLRQIVIRYACLRTLETQ